jgi:hypothetical protein
MAIIRVLGGAFLQGEGTVTKTGFQLRQADPGGQVKVVRIPFSAVRSVVPTSGDTRGGTEKVITGSIVGGMTLGITGAISSAMVNSQPAEVAFVVYLTDGRQFRAMADSSTWQQLAALNH